MSLVAQIEMDGLPRLVRDDLNLPHEGALALFVDTKGLFEAGGSPQARTFDLVHVTGARTAVSWPDDLSERERLPGSVYSTQTGWMLPPWNGGRPGALSESSWQVWSAALIKDDLDDASQSDSFVGGWPWPVQNAVEDEPPLPDRGQTARWRLLLQIGNASPPTRWLGEATLFVMIEQADLDARNWQAAELIVQFY